MKRKRKWQALVLALVLSTTTVIGSGTSFAFDNSANNTSKSIDDASQLEEAKNFEETDEGFISSKDGQTVEIARASETGDSICTFETSEISGSFSLPGYSPSTLSNETKAILKSTESNSTSAVIESAAGMVRTSFVIDNQESPESFPVSFEMREGEKLQFSKDLEGNEDGSIESVDESGNVLLAIGKPWAVDAKGNEVETHYEIRGTEVVQIVQHKNNEQICYPVVADPSVKFSGWFKSGSWGKTKAKSGTGAWKGTKEINYLHLVPTDSFKVSCVTSLSNGETANSFRSASWSLVKNKFKNSKKWKNEKSLKTQYYCHVNLLPVKGVKYGKWDINIEPARPNVSLSVCAKHGCNP